MRPSRSFLPRGIRRRLYAALLFIPLLAVGASSAHAGDVVVFAASSLTDALADIGTAYHQHANTKVRFSFASSATLARQIIEGAPADIYLSANIKWMDYVESHGKLLNGTRENLLANQLVLVAPARSAQEYVAIQQGFPLAQMLGGGRLAVGNPGHVPAGAYAREALKALGVWPSVRDHLARSANVRAALALVALGATPLGIVYRTDALASAKVKIVGLFPAASHAPIIYPVAMTAAASRHGDAARKFYRFMSSTAATAIFERYGFKVLASTHPTRARPIP